MKKTFKITMFVALAGLSLLACNNKEEIRKEEPSSVGDYTYTVAITGDTKSYLDGDHMAWDEDDAEYTVIGWFATATMYNGEPEEVSGYSKVDINSSPRTFTVNSHSRIDAGKYIYAFYAPYAVSEESKEAAPLSIPTYQNGVIRNAMPMVSLPIPVTSEIPLETNETIGTAFFVNLGAVIEYNVYTSDATYASEQVTGVQFSASSPIAGEFTVDLTAVAEDAIPAPSGLQENAVFSEMDSPETVGGSKSAGVKVYQVIAPGTFSGTVTVTTDAAVYEYTVTDLAFGRSMIKTLNVDLASANATRHIEAENLLKGTTWKIDAFGEYYDEKYPIPVGAALYADDTITFNADYTISYGIQNGIFNWDNSESEGYAYEPTGSERWALEEKSDGLYLTLSGGGIPLMMVSEIDAVDGSFKILSLTENLLSIYMPITEWDNYQTYIDFVPAAPADHSVEEALLTSTTWKIDAFGEYYDAKYPDETGAALYADDTITFNADYTISYGIQNGIFYWDNSATEGYGYVPAGTETWALEEKSDGLYLTLGGGAIPLMMVSETDAVDGSFKILSLTEDLLSIYMVVTEWGNYQAYIDFVPVTAE